MTAPIQTSNMNMMGSDKVTDFAALEKRLLDHCQNIHTLPDDLNPVDITSKTKEEVLAFSGELNPLSNFHPCKFNLEGETFNSSEQYIQWDQSKVQQ